LGRVPGRQPATVGTADLFFIRANSPSIVSSAGSQGLVINLIVLPFASLDSSIVILLFVLSSVLLSWKLISIISSLSI
jgi:hypothetical protein